jgi:hypothetical protein
MHERNHYLIKIKLTSRSPPIHEANRIGAEFNGKRLPAVLRSNRSRSRKKVATASQREFSTTAKPHFASTNKLIQF